MQKAISQIKPYKGGNDLLWELHRLDIIDKHRALPTVGIVHGGLGIGPVINKLITDIWTDIPFPPPSIGRLVVRTPRTGQPAKVGEVLHVGFICDEEANKNLEFPCEITITEPGVVEGKPLLETLKSMADLVDNIVSDLAPFLV